MADDEEIVVECDDEELSSEDGLSGGEGAQLAAGAKQERERDTKRARGAGAGVKKRSGGQPTCDPSVVSKWIGRSGWNNNDVWGFGDDDVGAVKSQAVTILRSRKEVICGHCGVAVESLKTRFEAHWNCKSCKHHREAYSEKVAVAKATVPPEQPPQRTWLNSSPTLLMAVRPLPAALAASGDPTVLRSLLSAVASSQGISFHAQQELFSNSSPFRAGLVMLGSHGGLGSDKTALQLSALAIEDVVREEVRLVFRNAVKYSLPICILSDESPAHGSAVLLVHVYTPSMETSMCVDITQLGRAANANLLNEGIKKVVVGNGHLTDDEFNRHVCIYSGDHASYVTRAAIDAGVDHAGDPAHAFDLVVKAILSSTGLRPLYMALRSVINSKSYVVARALEAFAMKASHFKVPVTRWGYYGSLNRLLTDEGHVVKLQQLLIWLHNVHYKGGDHPINLDGCWISGVPFQPLAVPAVFPVADAADVADLDWDDNEPDTEGAEEDDEPLRDSGYNGRRRDAIRKVLAVLSNPQVRALLLITQEIIDPIRLAQLKVQNADAKSEGIVPAFQHAYGHLVGLVESEESFQAGMSYYDVPLTQAMLTAVPVFRLSVEVTRSEGMDGLLTVDGVADLTTPLTSVVYPDAAAAKAAFQIVVSAARVPIKDGCSKYMERCAACFDVARRRSAAALHHDFNSIKMPDLLRSPQALPPSMRLLASAPAPPPPSSSDDPLGDLPPIRKAPSLSDSVAGQFTELTARVSTLTSTCYVSSADRDEPWRYWVRVRSQFPKLADVMLFWLAHPIGTPALERDFSGMTIVCRDSRRRRMQWATFRVAVLTRCHAGALRDRLLHVV